MVLIMKTFKAPSIFVASRPLPIDHTSSQDFNLGANGFPASSLNLLSKAQSQQEADKILERLRPFADNSNVKEDSRSFDEIIAETVPSWVQFPSEIIRFSERFLKPYLAKKQEVIKKQDDSK